MKTHFKPPQTLSIFRITLLALLFFTFTINSSYAGPLSDGFNATYTLSKNSITIATVKRQLKVNNNIFNFTSYAQAAGLASIITDETVKEQSVMEIAKGQLRSQLYSHNQKSSEHIIFILFNRTNNTIVNTRNVNIGKSKTWPLTENTFDILGFQIALAYALKNKTNNLNFNIAEKKRVGQHQLKIVGHETVQLAGQKLETIKLMYLDKNKNRQFTFWCAKALDFLPVRVQRKDADGDITLLEMNHYTPH